MTAKVQYLGIEAVSIPTSLWNLAREIRQKVLNENDGKSFGMCWDASSQICARLRKKGVSCKQRCASFRINGHKHGHAWVEIGKKRHYLDVTADQFNHGLALGNTRYQMRAIVFGTKKQLGRNLYS